jgi:hypothetical protein
MKIGLRTLLLAGAATAFVSCDRGEITAPPPPDALNAILDGSSISVREATCTTPTASFLQGSTVCAVVSFDINDDPETSARVEWRTPANVLAHSEETVYTDGPAGSKVLDPPPTYSLDAAAPTGTWTVRLCQLSCTTGLRATANFTVTAPGPAAQDITFPYPGDKTYGDEAFGLAATASSDLPVSYTSLTGDVCQVDASTVTILNAGTCTIRASQGGDGSTWAAAPDFDHDIPVTPRPITVTADAQQKSVGDADPTLTYAITSGALVGADALGGSLERAPGEDPGVYAIVQGSLTAGPNYDLHYVGADLTILEVSGSWTFRGFFLPVVMGAVTQGTAGSTIPLGFRIFVDGMQKTTTDGISFALVGVDCESFVELGETELTVPGATTLRYAGGVGGGGAFLLNWKTPQQPGCYQLTMSVEGGSLSAVFDLK